MCNTQLVHAKARLQTKSEMHILIPLYPEKRYIGAKIYATWPVSVSKSIREYRQK